MNDPLALKVTAPWAGPVTTVAVRTRVAVVSSVSLVSTPGAAMVSAVSSAVV